MPVVDFQGSHKAGLIHLLCVHIVPPLGASVFALAVGIHLVLEHGDVAT